MCNNGRKLIPIPLEYLTLSNDALLTGEQGTNRAPTWIKKQIHANNDLQAIYAWLSEFDHSPQTQRCYRKEAERLLLWTLMVKQRPLSSLNRDDLRDYQMFLMDPQPTADWCGPRKLRNNPNWRPFQRALSKQSTAQAITVINALFSYLVEAGYLSGNPLGLMRYKLKQRIPRHVTLSERFLEQAVWQHVVKHVETLPKNTPRQQKHYERIRFLFHLLYLLSPRVSEVAGAMMCDVKYLALRVFALN